MKRTLSDDVDELERSVRELGRAMSEALRLREFVAWLARKASR